MTNRTKVRAAVTLALTTLVVWVLMRRFGGSGLASIVVAARPSWVALSLLASCGCVLLGALRWRLVLSAMGYELPFRRSLEVVLATWPLALVTPSRAGDLARPLAVQDMIPLPAGTGSVLAEKMIDLLVLLLLAGMGTALQGLRAWTAAIGLLCVAEIVGIALLAGQRSWLERLPLFRRRRDTIEQLFGAWTSLRRAPRLLLAQVVASVSMRVLTIGIAHTLLLSVGAHVRLVDTMTLWPAATLVGLVPLTLAGIGTRDAAFIELVTQRGAHIDPTQLLAATVGYSAVAIGFFAILGLPFMARELLRTPNPQPPLTASPGPARPNHGHPF